METLALIVEIATSSIEKDIFFELSLFCPALTGKKVNTSIAGARDPDQYALGAILRCEGSPSPLTRCCDKCDGTFEGKPIVAFKNNHVVFSLSGEAKLSVKIRGVPTHNGRPRSTVFVLKIEIKNNSTSIEGERVIPFKKHYRAKKQPDSSPVILDEEGLSILNNTLLPLQRAIEYMSNKPAMSTTKRAFEDAYNNVKLKLFKSSPLSANSQIVQQMTDLTITQSTSSFQDPPTGQPFTTPNTIDSQSSLSFPFVPPPFTEVINIPTQASQTFTTTEQTLMKDQSCDFLDDLFEFEVLPSENTATFPNFPFNLE